MLAFLILFILLVPLLIFQYFNFGKNYLLIEIIDSPNEVEYSKDEIERHLIDFGLDDQFIKWAKGKKWEEIYLTCPNGHWLFSLYKKTNSSCYKTFLRINGHFARTVKSHMLGDSMRQLVESVISYSENKIGIKDLGKAQKKAESENGLIKPKSKWGRIVRNTKYANLVALSASTLNNEYNDTIFYLSMMDFVDMRLKSCTSVQKYYLNLRADICRELLPIEYWNLK